MTTAKENSDSLFDSLRILDPAYAKIELKAMLTDIQKEREEMDKLLQGVDRPFRDNSDELYKHLNGR